MYEICTQMLKRNRIFIDYGQEFLKVGSQLCYMILVFWFGYHVLLYLLGMSSNITQKLLKRNRKVNLTHNVCFILFWIQNVMTSIILPENSFPFLCSFKETENITCFHVFQFEYVRTITSYTSRICLQIEKSLLFFINLVSRNYA